MRHSLMETARGLFTQKGYDETTTPDIVAAAGVTRGALYHHFEDKKALFRAVVEREAQAVADAIAAASPPETDARTALLSGADAYFDAMAFRGRTRLLLVDGPAVLGAPVMRGIDAASAQATLRDGLATLMSKGTPLDPLTDLVSAAFDRAAIAISDGADRSAYMTAITHLIDGLAQKT